MIRDDSFEEGKIGNLVLKNRWIHSATYEGMAGDDGSCNDEIIRLNRNIAAGGVSANIVSFSYVHESGKCLRGQIGIHRDEMTHGLRKMAEAIKKKQCRAFIQLGHAGCHANSLYTGIQSIGPSEVYNVKGGHTRAMSKTEISDAVGWFAMAAKRAKEAGFDGVQLHMAHGYLLSSFLSPHYNHRTDEYGGSIVNRLRFPLEVIKAVRSTTGDNYPIIIKLNCEDGLEDGTTYDLMGEYVARLETSGIDAVELSGGCGADGALWPSSRGYDPKNIDDEGYFKRAASFYKNACALPLILVGGNRSLEAGNCMVKQKTCDFISVSRPLIREPELINRWKSGDRTRSKCISCNLCRDRLFSGKEATLKCPFRELNSEKKEEIE